ncbi:bifunctional DNA primase/polymerase [Microbacterium sp. AZCO]|uniref:bifunctional DNA primase/polymerase n=1 Tax=Microbacterium sp. AZCO TaxID=3142976 RepID=UPI0031F3C128
MSVLDIQMRGSADGFVIGLEEQIAARRAILPELHLHPTLGKVPAVDWGTMSSADPARRADMRRVRHDGWGAACKLSGVLVVDLDQHNPAADGFAQWVQLLGAWRGPQAGMVGATPGGGRHIWYTNPHGWKGHIGIMPGVDLRGAGDGAGSQVVIAGQGRLLRVLGPLTDPPAPLVALMTAKLAPAAPPRPAVRAGSGGLGARARALCEQVARAPEGERNARLYWAACRVSDVVADSAVSMVALQEALIAAAVVAGLDEDEARTTVGNAGRYSVAS